MVKPELEKLQFNMYMTEVNHTKIFNHSSKLDETIIDILKNDRQTKFSEILVIYDKLLLNISVSGSVSKGGVVTDSGTVC